jgi:hypothetical protein
MLDDHICLPILQSIVLLLFLVYAIQGDSYCPDVARIKHGYFEDRYTLNPNWTDILTCRSWTGGAWFLASEASESLVLNMTFDGIILRNFFLMFKFALAQNLTISQCGPYMPT